MYIWHYILESNNSCFKKLSRLLKGSATREALNSFSTVCKYKSLTDELLCEIVPYHKGECLLFYEGIGEKLFVDLYDIKYVNYMDYLLVTAVMTAQLMYKERQKMRWSRAKQLMLNCGACFPTDKIINNIIKNRRREINSCPLGEIAFYKNGSKVDILPKTVNDFMYTGLSNIDFITSGYYKGETDD